MKKLLVLLCLSCHVLTAQQQPQTVFTLKEKDLIPEGIAYDPAEKSFYVGSIHKHKVVKITAQGQVTDFIKTDQDNISEVLGMKVDNGKLWICSNNPDYDTLNKVSHLHIYDVKTGALISHVKHTDGKKHLFNDLYITTTGDTYITDADAGAVWVIRKGSSSAEEFLKPGSLRYPNGITATPDEKRLLISTGSALGVVRVDVETREIKSIPHEKFLVIGIDGLYRYNNTLVAIQNVLFPESVIQLFPSADWQRMERLELLAVNHAAFDMPTTGVIAGNEFYFIANAQLLQLRNTQGKIKEPGKLKETVIMKIKLN